MIILCVASLVLFLYYLYIKNFSYWKTRKIPYEKPFFIFGSLYDVVAGNEHLFETLRSIYNKFSTPYVGIYIFHKPHLLIRSPEILKTILVKDFNKFINRSIATDETADPLSFHTLLTAKDSVWRNMRAKLSPVFSSRKMKLMFPLMQECTKDMLSFLQEMADGEIEAKLMMKKYTIDVISSCAFGIKTYSFQNRGAEIFKVATKLLNFDSLFRGFSMFCFFFLHKFVHIFKLTMGDKPSTDYLFNMFITTLREREKKKIIRNDLIDLLINLRNSETISDYYKFDTDIKMAAQGLLFFSAGSDSSSLTLALACYEIALNQTIQDRIRREVTHIFNDDKVFTYENVVQMKYLDMVLKETLRKYPLAPFMLREASVDYTFEETGFTIEQGVAILVPLSGLHHDPEYFPEPEKFDPERFNEKNRNNLTPFSFLPFGEGPRHCIGERFAVLAIKLALANIFKDFMFEPSEKTPAALTLDPRSLFVQNKGGLFLKVVKL